jgi:hypothetical protein
MFYRPHHPRKAAGILRFILMLANPIEKTDICCGLFRPIKGPTQ